MGDIVKISDREAFPADLLFLRGSDPEPGQAWVNTKPLDGESDTKLRIAVKQTAALLKDASPATLAKVAAALRARRAHRRKQHLRPAAELCLEKLVLSCAL